MTDESLKFSGKKRPYSKIGLGLCAVYLAITALCIIGAAMSDKGQDEGKFVLLSLPLLPVTMLLTALHIIKFFREWNWCLAYAIFLPVILAALYGVGRILTRCMSRDSLKTRG